MHFLIDGQNVAWRVFYAAGTITGDVLAHGIVATISKAASLRPNASLLVFWDQGEPKYRSKLFPAYKQNREEAKSKVDLEEFQRQVSLARTYLDFFAVRQISIPGIEADDLISWCATYLGEKDKVQILTSDRDIWQIVSENITVIDALRNFVVTPELAKEVFGVPARDIPFVKAFSGDDSDNLPGVKGIGKKTASAFLQQYPRPFEAFDDEEVVKDLKKKKKTSLILDSVEEVGFNYRLVKLSDHKQAKWYLTPAERLAFRSALSKEVKRNDLGIEDFSKRAGFRPVMQHEPSQRATEALAGFAPESVETPRFGSLEALDEAVLSCNRCELRKACGSYGPTLPAGYSDAEIMIIGRNPGLEELKSGTPFIGRAGKRLDTFLAAAGLSRREIWVSNSCKCYSEANRPPTGEELLACSAYIDSEIEILKPKLILTFGNEAMSLVTPYTNGVTKHCGEILENPYGFLLERSIPAWVCICVHPSAALRSSQNSIEMDYAADQLKKFLAKF